MQKTVIFLALTSLVWCNSVFNRVRHRVMLMEVTAYARARQPTAAGNVAHEGGVAADPSVLPLGTRIRIVGPTSDLYLPSKREAQRFGIKTLRVKILQIGRGKADARNKDNAPYEGYFSMVRGLYAQ
jgi:3D (Asp-Asp-Asp) domain-containing protein